MYIEYNWYSVYDYSFNFPIEEGEQTVSIDCTSWSVYVENDISQGLACAWTGNTATGTFNIVWSTNLILEDYINNIEVSFGTLNISEVTAWEEHIFESEESMKTFYIFEITLFWVLIFIIFLKKLFQ